MSVRRLYVGNLPFETPNGEALQEGNLLPLFSEHGKITDIILMRDSATGRLRGFGFIEFATDEEANRALVLDGVEFHGRALNVQFASPRPTSARVRTDAHAND